MNWLTPRQRAALADLGREGVLTRAGGGCYAASGARHLLETVRALERHGLCRLDADGLAVVITPRGAELLARPRPSPEPAHA